MCAQPTGLTEDVAPDEVDLHQHAHHSERGKGERSPETRAVVYSCGRAYGVGRTESTASGESDEQARRGDDPVPRAARREPGGLVRVGGRRVRARARAEDKPLLVSVGYSSCHWCHVMAHESFESETTAALMNELFVNVKVDREERPDVDAVTMEAAVGMTGSGGWPTTVFMTPDAKPFYAGTYFPPEPRHGIASFPELLRAVCGDLAGASRRHRAAGGTDRWRFAGHGGLGGVDRAAHLVSARRCRACDRRELRAGIRRVRARPEVPGGVDARASPAPRERAVAGDGHRDARRNGRRWLLRRRRRRLPSLLRGRSLARPALREDALRQRRPHLDLPARVGRHRARALSRGRRGDARLHAPRACLARRRLRVRPRCGHGRRRGADLHVDAGRGRRSRAPA